VSRADNTAHLRRAAADRHDAATRRTIAVIDEFDRNGTSATVAGVASAAGVARSWLYEQPDLLAATVRLRDRTTSTNPAPGRAASNRRLSPATSRRRTGRYQ
jgi:hypothetical protein